MYGKLPNTFQEEKMKIIFQLEMMQTMYDHESLFRDEKSEIKF
jgi:hypothetical protein